MGCAEPVTLLPGPSLPHFHGPSAPPSVRWGYGQRQGCREGLRIREGLRMCSQAPCTQRDWNRGPLRPACESGGDTEVKSLGCL